MVAIFAAPSAPQRAAPRAPAPPRAALPTSLESYSTDETAAVVAWVVLEVDQEEGVRKSRRATTKPHCSPHRAVGLLLYNEKAWCVVVSFAGNKKMRKSAGCDSPKE